MRLSAREEPLAWLFFSDPFIKLFARLVFRLVGALKLLLLWGILGAKSIVLSLPLALSLRVLPFLGNSKYPVTLVLELWESGADVRLTLPPPRLFEVREAVRLLLVDLRLGVLLFEELRRSGTTTTGTAPFSQMSFLPLAVGGLDTVEDEVDLLDIGA